MMNHKEEDKEIRYTPWITFCWAIGLLTTLVFAILWVSVNAQSQSAATRSEVAGHVDSSKTEMEWVKSSLTRIEGKLDKIQ